MAPRTCCKCRPTAMTRNSSAGAVDVPGDAAKGAVTSGTESAAMGKDCGSAKRKMRSSSSGSSCSHLGRSSSSSSQSESASIVDSTPMENCLKIGNIQQPVSRGQFVRRWLRCASRRRCLLSPICAAPPSPPSAWLAQPSQRTAIPRERDPALLPARSSAACIVPRLRGAIVLRLMPFASQPLSSWPCCKSSQRDSSPAPHLHPLLPVHRTPFPLIYVSYPLDVLAKLNRPQQLKVPEISLPLPDDGRSPGGSTASSTANSPRPEDEGVRTFLF